MDLIRQLNQILQEQLSLADMAAGKGPPARTTYPKTKFKQFADDWNSRLYAWVREQIRAENTLSARNEDEDDTLVIDAYNGSDLVASAVIEMNVGPKKKDTMFSFFNHVDAPGSKYDVVSHRNRPWKFKPVSLENMHHSDQRNRFTSNNPSRNGANSRARDGETIKEIISSTRM